MISLTEAFEYISLSFQNIFNCCSPFDCSSNLVSAMILGSNRTDVSILINSPSLTDCR